MPVMCLLTASGRMAAVSLQQNRRSAGVGSWIRSLCRVVAAWMMVVGTLSAQEKTAPDSSKRPPPLVIPAAPIKPAPPPPPPPPFIESFLVKGNQALSADAIRAELLTRENTKYFGFWRVGLMFYNFGGIFTALGEPPRTFSRANFELDMFKLRDVYHFAGYNAVTLDTAIVLSPDQSRVNLSLTVAEGTPLLIDSLGYDGIDSIDAEVRAAVLREPAVKAGDVFTYKALLLDERERIAAVMQEGGYALFVPDSIIVEADTVGFRAAVRFKIRPSERLVFGDIAAIVHNPVGADSLGQVKVRTDDGITTAVFGETNLSEAVVRRALAYFPDRRADNSSRLRTRRQLGNTGVFESISIRNDSVIDGRLYTTIDMRQQSQHQLRLEPLLSNQSAAPTAALTASYLNRNLFGMAESFQLKTSAGVQLAPPALPDSLRDPAFLGNLLGNFEASAEIGFPYFFTADNRFSITTQAGIFQQPLFRLQNVLLRFRAGFVHNEFQRSVFDIFQLEYVQIDTSKLRAVADQLTGRFFDLGYQTHLNASLRYDFFFSNLTEARRPIDLRWTVSVEEAGATLYAIDQLFDRRQYDGFTDTDAQILGLRYFQFVKLRTEVAVAKNLIGKSTTAVKLVFGALFPYGKSRVSPIERRFFAGGANSVRGWQLNQLGPGGNPSAATASSGADYKFEMSLEHRIPLNTTFGVVVFTDAGNIWNRTGDYALTAARFLPELGFDAGLGVRLNTPIGPLRLDFAWKLWDPRREANDRALFSRLQLVGDTGATFSFGIGEAF